MSKVARVAAALVGLLAIPASAEDSLVVVDSAGTVLGPVIGRSGPNAHSWVDLMIRDGTEFVVLSANAAGVFASTGTFYFQDADCVTTPHWVGDPITVGVNLTPPATVSGMEVYAIDEGATHFLSSLSHIHVGSSAWPVTCHQEGYAGLEVRDVTLLRTLPGFTPPLHLELNPLVFNDGFASGDTRRWNLALP